MVVAMIGHHAEMTAVEMIEVQVAGIHHVEMIEAGMTGLHVEMIAAAMTEQRHENLEFARVKELVLVIEPPAAHTYSQVTLSWEKLSGELMRMQEKAAEKASQDLRIVKLPAKTK
jgi:hypothetical protein